MELVVTLKKVRIDGEVVKPGQTIRVPDGKALIEQGYARRLTRDEVRSILKLYVNTAIEVFSEKAGREPKLPETNKQMNLL